MSVSAVELAMVALVGIVSGLAALRLAAMLPAPRPRAPAAPLPEDLAFVFLDGALTDASPAARLLLDVAPAAADDLSQLAALLDPWFPGLPGRLCALAPAETAEIAARAPCAARIRAERGRRALRLVLADPPGPGVPVAVAILAREARALRALVEDAPLPIWIEDAEGRVRMANVAARNAQAATDDPGRPPLGDRPDTGDPGPRRQVAAALPGQAPRWFDRHDIARARGGRVVYALPADEVVRAEAALRGFLQTVSRSFAHLPVGLAVFDANWRLSLFNPALGDMTGLPPAFLAGRPTLHGVLDRLRELRMIPEPRDYAAWRRRLSDIERTADSGHYTELWPLPSGQTFRVTGKPNAEGGVALLFENITADTARNRSIRGRADTLEAGFAALGRVAAIYGPGGGCMAAGARWRHLLGEAHAADIGTALARWAGLCHPTPVWAELQARGGLAEGREDTVLLRDGRVLALRVLPLPGGAVLLDLEPCIAGGADRPGLGAVPGHPGGTA